MLIDVAAAAATAAGAVVAFVVVVVAVVLVVSEPITANTPKGICSQTNESSRCRSYMELAYRRALSLPRSELSAEASSEMFSQKPLTSYMNSTTTNNTIYQIVDRR